ncbi:MAG: hypothetical protein IJC20_02440 [Clostridia bacterium]|nr:hypothetical protein [Clostridia bacterium]
MKPLKINLLGFESAVLQSEIPVLLVFGAMWDADSRMLFSLLDKYKDKLDGKVKLGIVDYDYVPDIFSEYEVFDIPTMIIFDDGKPEIRHTGYNGSDDIDKILHHFFGYRLYSSEF